MKQAEEFLAACIFVSVVCVSMEVNAFVTELSCSPDMCVPQTVQYHCETSMTTLMWMQGSVQLGGYSIDSYLLTKDGYYVTVVFKDGGGISSNISFMAEGNNGTTIECVGSITEVNIITYSCLLIIPPIPVAKDLMFTVLNGTSVSLHWTSPPTTAPHCTSGYTVQVNLTENDTIDQTKHTDQPAVNISSLTMNTNHSYRVAGVDNAGRMGEWSDKQCFHLKVPGPVNISVNVSDVPVMSLTVTWKVDQSDLSPCVPPVNGFSYTVLHEGNNPQEIDGGTSYDQTSLNISNIQQGVKYVITIVAHNDVGEGMPAMTIIDPVSIVSTSSFLSTDIPMVSAIELTQNSCGWVTAEPTSTSTATGCNHSVPVLLSVCVSGALSSIVTALITATACLVVKRGRATKESKKTTPIHATPPPIYDTVTETTGKESFELTGNVAYAHITS